MKKIFLCLVVIYSVLLSTACPSPASIEKAKSASSKLSTLANQGVNITRELYQEKTISADLAKTITEKFIVLADGGIAFDAAVAALEKQSGAAASKSQIEQLFSVFNSEVVSKFLQVLASAKLVKNAGVLAEAILILQTAVLMIAKAFNRRGDVLKQIEAVRSQ